MKTTVTMSFDVDVDMDELMKIIGNPTSISVDVSPAGDGEKPKTDAKPKRKRRTRLPEKVVSSDSLFKDGGKEWNDVKVHGRKKAVSEAGVTPENAKYVAELAGSMFYANTQYGILASLINEVCEIDGMGVDFMKSLHDKWPNPTKAGVLPKNWRRIVAPSREELHNPVFRANHGHDLGIHSKPLWGGWYLNINISHTQCIADLKNVVGVAGFPNEVKLLRGWKEETEKS